MKKTLLLIFAALVLAGLGGATGWLALERADLAAKLAASESRANALEKEAVTLRSAETRAKRELSSYKSSHPPVAAAPPAPSSTGTASTTSSSKRGAVTPLDKNDVGQPASTKPMQALSNMMKNPAMREMAKQQQIAMLDLQYGSLYDAFGLSDEEKANFKQLLAERVSIDAEMGMKLMDDTLTPDQRKEVLNEINEQKKQSSERIRTFLNSDDDYKSFEHFENTKAERMALSMSKGYFSSTPLTPNQEQQLVDTMHEIAMRPSNVPNLQKPENFDPRKFTQADVERQLQKLDNDAQAVANAAQKFLSPEQLQALKQAQTNWRTMQEASFKMMNSMLGSGK